VTQQRTSVTNAQEATDTALAFLAKYYAFRLPTGARKEDGSWVVTVNVGVFVPEIAEVKINSQTREVVSYQILQRQ
jgi:hypothetical protein